MKHFSRINPSIPTDSEVQPSPIVQVEREVLSLDLATPHGIREGQVALHVSEPWRGLHIERCLTKCLIHLEAVRGITQDGAPSQEGADSRDLFHQSFVSTHGGAPPRVGCLQQPRAREPSREHGPAQDGVTEERTDVTYREHVVPARRDSPPT